MKVKVLWKGKLFNWAVVSEREGLLKHDFRTYYLAKDWAHEQGYEVLS